MQSDLFDNNSDTNEKTIGSTKYWVKKVYNNVHFQFHYNEDNGYYTYDSADDSAQYDAGNNEVSIEPHKSGSGYDKGFWPFDAKRDFTDHKFSFGMSMGIGFKIPTNGKVNGTPMVFQFSGDDDVWVFLDGKLALDMGGIHQARAGSIDFSTGTAETEYVLNPHDNGSVDTGNFEQNVTKNIYDDLEISRNDSAANHTLKIFYMERGDGYSNCKIKFNIPTTSVVPETKLNLAKTARAVDGYNDAASETYRTYAVGLTASNATTVTDYREVNLQDEEPGAGPWYKNENGTGQIYCRQETQTQNTLHWYTSSSCSSDSEVTVTSSSGDNPLYTKSTDYDEVSSSYVTSHKNETYYIKSGSSYSQVHYGGTTILLGDYWLRDGSSNKYFPYLTQFYQQVNQYTKIDIPPSLSSGTEYYVQNTPGNYVRVYFNWIPSSSKIYVWYSNSAFTDKLSPQPTVVYVPDEEGEDVEDAIVRDYIDPRFIVVDEDGHPIEDGGEVTDGGILHIGDDQTYVEWTDQIIPAAGDDPWQKSFCVQAKENFIGGNDIPTNGDGSGDGKSGVYQEDESGDLGEELGAFTSPTVNVPVKFEVNPAGETIFYGEKIQASGLPDSMFDEDDVGYITDEITGDFSYNWYSDLGCQNKIGNGTLAALQGLTPSDNTLYYLQVSFTPKLSGTASEENGGAPVGIVSEKNAYTVTVVKGELDLTKTITDLYPATNPDNGAEQSFVFKIIRADELNGAAKDTFYEVITPDAKLAPTQKIITGLKKGYYTVTEESDAWRYTPKENGLTDNDGAYDGKVFIGNHIIGDGDENLIYFGAQTGSTACTPNPATVEFTDELAKKSWFSDTTVVVNTIKNWSEADKKCVFVAMGRST